MTLLEPMRRGAILVRDMARSLEFWKEGLGLEVMAEGRVGRDHASFHRLLGVTPGAARYVILRASPLAIGMVGLFELIDPPPEHAVQRNRDDLLNVGEVALVFTCPDIAAVHRAVVRAGLPVLCPPIRFELPEHGVWSVEMMFRDPNGVAVNCIQQESARNRPNQ